MKHQPIWPNPKPSLFSKPRPEIVALETRKAAQAADLSERRSRFFKDSVNYVNGVAVVCGMGAFAAIFMIFGR
ncbi:hypothetical protein [Caulobacter sp. DWR1-3-2b1]|uniref:hypothetical protein n=1 Tax=Caulobacter sp. DWR1-3-2b1 TaxID=2804670 RepID=UPI003CED41FF